MVNEAPELDRDTRRRAIDPAASYIVQAPAGSGKTTLLTLRYLRLLAAVDRPEEIVAITFTRKAAAEMRHRIVDALGKAGSPLAPGADERERELHRLASAALSRSRDHGWGLEHNPARLHVQTIDGLNHWLARRLPLAAGIGTSATLVDDARALYAEAARRTADLLEEDTAVAAGLARLARSLDHDPGQLAALIENMLGARELWLPKILGAQTGLSLRAAIDRLLRQALESELAAVAGALAGADWKALFGICRSAAAAGAPRGPVVALAAHSGLPPALADAVPAWCALAELLLKAEPSTELRKVVDGRQGFLAAAEGAGWPVLKQAMRDFLGELEERDGVAAALARLRVLPPPALTDAQWERIEALAVVLPHAAAELLALFAERASLDHSAVAAAARDALGDPSAPTELALSLDYRIRHLLVDEYQDTSPSQARLLELLVAGWQPGDGRSLFCVGDPMQSIYAFREADVTLFLQAQRQGIGGVALRPERLGRNFRSSAAIVDWVNASFARLLPADDDFERGAVRYSAAAAVRTDQPGDGVRVHALLDADERRMAAEVAAVAAEAIASLGNPSIAILVRGRPSLPPILAALREAGIRYRGVELETLLDRPAIRDLVALLRALLHDGDRGAWLAVLRAPWCGLPLADLLALAGDDGRSIRECLRVPAGLAPESARRALACRAVLEAPIAARGGRSLGGWLKSAWLALGGPATVADDSDLANAELLFTALDRLELESGCRPQASEIEAAVAGVMASPVGSDDARVQVMTIHRAKGLEFDVVILPDLQRGPRGAERPLLYWTTVATGPGERGIVLGSRTDASEDEGADALERWMRELNKDREKLELGRLAYVAATRARRRLHLIGSATVLERKDGIAIRPPRARSLLRFLWPVVSEQFEAALAARPADAAPRERSGRRRLTAPAARRLASDYRVPEPPALAFAPVLRISGAPEGSVRPEFDWAGAIAQAVGQVVHAELQGVAEAGAAFPGDESSQTRWRRALAALGMDDAHLPAALERVRRAMAAVATSERAARLLDPDSQDGRSELALTAMIDGAAHSLRIDRTFVDENGVRWIVDWKVSAHEGGDREAFLDAQLERYRPQLERYARAMKLLEPDRPLKVGLYFPLQDAWREL